MERSKTHQQQARFPLSPTALSLYRARKAIWAGPGRSDWDGRGRERRAPELVLEDFPELPPEPSRVALPPGGVRGRLRGQAAQQVLRLGELDHGRSPQRREGAAEPRICQAVRDTQGESPRIPPVPCVGVVHTSDAS